MPTMRTIVLFTLFLCCLSWYIPVYTAESATVDMTEKNLEKMLQEVFEKKPELIINVLRNNSEAVLDIAQEGSTKKRKRALEAQWQQDMSVPKKVTLENRPVFGTKNAPVTVIEFSDFTCTYCAQAAINLKKLMSTYEGKVNVVFKHTPLSSNPTSLLASKYVIAAGWQSEKKALRLYEAYFAGQQRLLQEGEAFLNEVAKNIGLDMQKLIKDSKSTKVLKIIEEDLNDAKDLNVEGTPFFLVNNLVLRGSLPFEFFKSAIDMALAKK